MWKPLFAKAFLLAAVAQPIAPKPRASEVDWVKRHEAIKKAAHGPVDVLLLGDSITAGWQYKDHWGEAFPGVSAVNAGIVSDRVEHLLWRLDDGLLERVQPKAVVLLIGVNNLAFNDADRIAATHAQVLQRIAEKLPKAKVLLLGVLPAGQEPTDKRRGKIRELNERLAKLADGDRVRYLDIGARFLDDEGRLTKKVSFDYLHFTAKGYEIFADGIRDELERMTRNQRVTEVPDPING